MAGPENRLALSTLDDLLSAAAALRDEDAGLADRAACPYNPLVLTGTPGVGKSLLLRELASRWEVARPEDRIWSVSGVDFAHEYAHAVERDRVAAWRAERRAVDLWVLDDLGQLAARQAAHLELQHALDELLARGAQVVIASRLAPLQLTALPRTLVGRLSAGVLVPLVSPGNAARETIVLQLAAERGLRFDPAAAKLLAESYDATAPELSGVLHRLQAESKANDATIDLQQVRAWLAHRTPRVPPTLRTIAAAVARQYGAKVTDLRGPSRRQSVVIARGVAMHLSRQLTDKSLQRIGAYFGGRDHTTVSHGCQKTEQLLQSDAVMRLAVAQIREAVAAQIAIV